MAKKHKIKNEDPSINFRLSPELRKWIVTEAISENKTLSNYLRDHLSAFKEGTLYEKEVGSYRDRGFINSTEFLQLITFLFSKRSDRKCVSTDEQLDRYIRTIKKMEMQEIPSKLMEEFDKVLVDLIRVKKANKKYHPEYFKFCERYYLNDVFDYDMLENFLLNVLKPYQEIYVDV